MFKILRKHEHKSEIPNFARAQEVSSYPFEDLSIGDFIEIFIDHDKDWEIEVMYEHDIVFSRNHESSDGKMFRHQPLLAERLIRIWRIM